MMGKDKESGGERREWSVMIKMECLGRKERERDGGERGEIGGREEVVCVFSSPVFEEEKGRECFA